MNSNRFLFLLFAASTFLVHPRQLLAQQTTAFTYQGQLRDGGTNANGAYNMTFKLFDALSDGGQIGNSITTNPILANGLFTVNLDFGAGAFNGTGRWLEITAKKGAEAPETLTPRVQVLPSPYALFTAAAGTLANDTWTVTVEEHEGSTRLEFTRAGENRMTVGDGVLIEGHLSVDGQFGISAVGNISTESDVFARNVKLTSDRNAKEQFAPVDARRVLEQVTGLPITSWSFKSDPATRHIGPMAQDFHAAFKLGDDDKHIATVDGSGVALAAIQGLHEIVKEKEGEIAALKQRLMDLEKVVSELAKQKATP